MRILTKICIAAVGIVKLDFGSFKLGDQDRARIIYFIPVRIKLTRSTIAEFPTGINMY